MALETNGKNGKGLLWFVAGFALALILAGTLAAGGALSRMQAERAAARARAPRPSIGVDLSKYKVTLFPKFPLSYASALRSLSKCEYFPTIDEASFIGEGGISVTLWGITEDATMDYVRIESPDNRRPPQSKFTPIGLPVSEIGMPDGVVKRTPRDAGRKLKGSPTTYSWIENIGGVEDAFYFVYANDAGKCVGFRVTVLPREAPRPEPAETEPAPPARPTVSGFLERVLPGKQP